MPSEEPPRRQRQPEVGSAVDSDAAVVVTGLDGRVTRWSASAERLWGYTSADIVGKPLTVLFTGGDWTPRHRGGQPLDAQAHLFPLPDENEQPTQFVLVAQRRGSGRHEPEDDELTRWMFEQYPSPLGIYERDARIRRHNKALSRAIGRSEDEARGQLVTRFLEGPLFEESERRAVQVARTGVPDSRELFIKAPGEPRAHAWAVDIFPLRDADDQVRAVGMSAYDYSEQYGSRQRLALLSEARTRIGSSLDVAGTAFELAEVSVPRFADAVGVDLLDVVLHGELPPVPYGPVLLRRVAYRSASESPETRHSPHGTRRHAASSLIARCLVSGEAALRSVTEAEVDLVFPGCREHRQGLPLGEPSLMVVPVRTLGRTLGVASFLRIGGGRDPFNHDDLAVTEDLIARAAVCLDNARRYTRERQISLTLQRNLLPRGPTPHPAVETATRYLPAGGAADVGGDWFDVISLPGARVGLVVGDVVGHGIHASAAMGQLRTAVRTLADIDLPPDELLTHLDDIVTHASDGEEDLGTAADRTGEIAADVGASCLYAVYDPVSGSLTLARAGHPPPVLVNPDGTARVLEVPAGPPLGLGSLPFEAAELTVPEGSVLALFTDGLIKTRDRDPDEALEELCRGLAQPMTSIEDLCDNVLTTLAGGSREDDIALLVARTRGLDTNHVASWELPSDPAAVAETRRLVGARLTAWGMDEAAFTTELVVSELVTNAIRYAHGPLGLRLIRDRTLICEVSDGSSTSPHLRRARLSDEGGRGLFLVAELTERWGTRYTSTGKTIWAEQSVDGL